MPVQAQFYVCALGNTEISLEIRAQIISSGRQIPYVPAFGIKRVQILLVLRDQRVVAVEVYAVVIRFRKNILARIRIVIFGVIHKRRPLSGINFRVAQRARDVHLPRRNLQIAKIRSVLPGARAAISR